MVDGKPWDPDLKALALVRPVLDALRRNFVWTTVLGEAYAARPAEVLRAVQSLRREALAAGELSSTPEQRVITTGGTILIEPVDLERVHVPGGPAFDVTVFYRFPWGWLSWDVDWGAGAVRYHDLPYVAGLRP